MLSIILLYNGYDTLIISIGVIQTLQLVYLYFQNEVYT